MADTLRTIHVVGHLDFGGGERRVALIAQSLAARGHKPTVVCLHEGGAYGEQLRAQGIPVHELRALHRGDALRVPHLARLMRDARPDVLDCHMSNAIWFGSMAGKLARVVPPVCSLYNLATWQIGWRRRLDEWFLARASAVVVDSHQLRAEITSRSRVPAENVKVIYTGVTDPEQIPELPPPEAVRREVGIPGDRRVVGMIARFERHKDHECVVRAIPGILRLHPNTHFVFLGPDQDKAIQPRMRSLAESLGVLGHMTICRYDGHIAAAHRVLDVCVLPSWSESIPVAIIEAMAAGRPVIAGDVGGIAELVFPGRTGYLMQPGDCEALVRHTSELLSAPELRERFGAEARSRFEKQFSVQIMIDQIEALFAQSAGK